VFFPKGDSPSFITQNRCTLLTLLISIAILLFPFSDVTAVTINNRSKPNLVSPPLLEQNLLSLPDAVIKMLIISGHYLQSFSVCVNRAKDKDRALTFMAHLMKRAIKGPGTKIRRVPGPTKPLLSM
jgi:hypothetical protein